MVFSRIVCGVDGSDAGRLALGQVRRLAATESRIVAVSVSERHLAVHAGLLAAQAAERFESTARAALEEAEALGLETRLVHGRSDEALLKEVIAERATLVAVGSHELSRGAGIMLGSVATRVVHDAPCSVLIARPTSEFELFPRSIVVGVDGSPASSNAAAVALELGAQVGAPVTILAVGSEPDLDETVLGQSGLAVERREGKPVPLLVEMSEQVDLLIVGSRGLHGLRALGSVSERLAHHARCSLLVVRPSDR